MQRVRLARSTTCSDRLQRMSRVQKWYKQTLSLPEKGLQVAAVHGIQAWRGGELQHAADAREHEIYHMTCPFRMPVLVFRKSHLAVLPPTKRSIVRPRVRLLSHDERNDRAHFGPLRSRHVSLVNRTQGTPLELVIKTLSRTVLCE